MATKSSGSQVKATRRRKRTAEDQPTDEVTATTVENQENNGAAEAAEAATQNGQTRSPAKRTRRRKTKDEQPAEVATAEMAPPQETSHADSAPESHSEGLSEPSQGGSTAGLSSGDEGGPRQESQDNDGGEGGATTGRRRRRRRRRRNSSEEGGGGGGRPQRGQSRSKSKSYPQSRDSRNRSRGRRPQPISQNGHEVTGTIEGVLELHPKGYGFLRDPQKNYAAQETDAFVSSSMIEKFGLREGVLVRGEVGPGSKGQGPRLKSIETIDARTPEEYHEVKHFDELTAISPYQAIRLETGPKPITMRVMDLLTPIGKGQRALIVAPPRTGKTMLLQDIADAVSANHPEVHLMVLLIDERPEEVTEMRRRVRGEVIASSMDREVESHVRISQLIVERGKRLAEEGKDVFILLDSITRTARAFNKWGGNTGRTMSGGLDVKALDIPKKMFGTARQFDEGGSLTIAATALIETGSRMDEVIFQEFKGTGNMELVLSRDLADRRIWPAIDIAKSGTRHEEKLFTPEMLEGVTMLRRSLVSLNPIEAMEQLTRTLERFPTNEEFLKKIRAIL